MHFSTRELRDYAIAWAVLSVAFTFFFNRGLVVPANYASGAVSIGDFARLFGASGASVGVGFLLHELAHKVVAVRFGQLAEFRADYSMLLLALMAGLAGFLFAAPGAVHHRGRITMREQGLIALAGPLTNVALVAMFVPIWIAGSITGIGVVTQTGFLGIMINALLAGFNMIPFGPLDGRTVKEWSTTVYAAVAVPTIGAAAWLLFL
jgi:Zn-dependent protease